MATGDCTRQQMFVEREKHQHAMVKIADDRHEMRCVLQTAVLPHLGQVLVPQHEILGAAGNVWLASR